MRRASRTPSAVRNACTRLGASLMGASSTNQSPSQRVGRTQVRTASAASLVFPAPPGPTIVVSRPDESTS